MQNPNTSRVSQNKFNLGPKKLLRKSFTIQKLINFLVVIRFYLSEVPLWLFSFIIIFLYLFKVRKQGNIPTSIFTILSFSSLLVGQYLKNGILITLAPLFCGLSYFLSYKIYWFPKVTVPFGFRQHVLENNLYMIQLYQIKQNQNIKRKIIRWNHRLELDKMMEYSSFNKNYILKSIGKFFTSSVNKYKIVFAEGDQQSTQTDIVFSHGRTATPLMYSQIFAKLMALQQKQVSIFSVQHTQKKDTGQIQIQKMKKFRQIQVQVRAAQMYSAIQNCKNKKQIILMGHSYGCSTTLQAYHSLPDQIKKKISSIILLDPWFFPLTQAKFKQQIKCPVLILANEFFLQNEDVYNRNNNFLEVHKKDRIIYLIWKNGDHLHQTDLGFIVGNSLNKVKRSDLSLQMLEKNIDAIRIFLEDSHISFSKMRQKFEGQILQQSYKPQKFVNKLNY